MRIEKLGRQNPAEHLFFSRRCWVMHAEAASWGGEEGTGTREACWMASWIIRPLPTPQRRDLVRPAHPGTGRVQKVKRAATGESTRAMSMQACSLSLAIGPLIDERGLGVGGKTLGQKDEAARMRKGMMRRAGTATL